MLNKRNKGFASLLPVILIAGVLVLGLWLSKSNAGNPSQDKNVLSESTDGEGSDSKVSSSVVTTVSAEESGSKTPEPTDKPEIKNQNENTNLNENEGETQNKEQEMEMEQEREFEVKEGTEEANIKVSSQGGIFRFRQTDFGAESHFPLSVDQTTRQLTVTTPAGIRIVAILPDQAVKNMLAANAISQVSTDNNTGLNQITLTTDKDGNLVYEINGVKYEKLLGIFNVVITKTGQVSAENGQVVGLNQSFFSRLLDIFSV